MYLLSCGQATSVPVVFWASDECACANLKKKSMLLGFAVLIQNPHPPTQGTPFGAKTYFNLAEGYSTQGSRTARPVYFNGQTLLM